MNLKNLFKTVISVDEIEIWKRIDVFCRRWHGPIQDLTLKKRIRRLITDLNSNTTTNDILFKVTELYKNDPEIEIKVNNFTFPKQKVTSGKHFIIEVMTKSETTLQDTITEYCSNRKIKIRPWRGKLPQTLQNEKPTFV